MVSSHIAYVLLRYLKLFRKSVLKAIISLASFFPHRAVKFSFFKLVKIYTSFV